MDKWLLNWEDKAHDVLGTEILTQAKETACGGEKVIAHVISTEVFLNLTTYYPINYPNSSNHPPPHLMDVMCDPLPWAQSGSCRTPACSVSPCLSVRLREAYWNPSERQIS